MPVDSEGRWYPGLFPKQLEALSACLPGKRNIVLLNGSRMASKTFACHHAVAQHAWNTDRGNICILTITQSAGIDSGVWEHLTDLFLPDWISGEFGMDWVKKPYIQNVTKKPACVVSNKHGNKTKISLESLKNEDEVEERFKGKAYSMIWINELSKFKKRKTFDTLKKCLNRLPHLTNEQHLFLADTNPDLDLGSQSWIYKLWYELAQASDDELKAFCPEGEDSSKMKPLRDSLRLIEFTIDDNLSLSKETKDGIYADFMHDEDLLAAYYYGKWVTASVDALFHKVFRPLFHVIGESKTPLNKDPDMMFPEPDCMELITGWDPGGTNCAAAILEKFFPAAIQYNGRPAFKVLDEQVLVDQAVDLQEFVNIMLAKMAFWEKAAARPILWTHWSDRSAFEMKDLGSNKYYHQLIFEMSGGKIDLMASERGPGSVRSGVDLFRRLLWEERIWFNRATCPQAINMCKSIKRGKSAAAVIMKGSPHKHALDMLRYPLQSICYEEINRSIMMMIRKSSGVGGVVHVPYAA